MRQGQQNRRGRGRNNNNNNNNNNNRRSQNPLTRSFESAGPDVKLRGTPSHIAEKYISLARDALSSGDPVLAENYLQHAEHYNRIILSFREQQMSQGGDPYQNGMARTHSLNSPDGEGEDFGDDDGDDMSAQGQPGAGQADAPQPNVQPPPQRFDNRPPRHDNQHRGDNRNHNANRHDRGDNSNRYDRGDRQDRFGGDQRGYRDDRGNQQSGNGQSADGNGGYRRRDRFGGPNSGQGFPQGAPRDQGDAGPQPTANGFERNAAPPASQPAPQQTASDIAPDEDRPAFLRRPVRRPRRDEGEAPAAQPATEDQD